MKSILIAMDESQASKSALDFGLALAKIADLKIKGLYIEDVRRLLEAKTKELAIARSGGKRTSLSDASEAERLIENEFMKEGEHLKEVLENSCKNYALKSSLIIQRGRVDETIVNASRTVDLVVIGRRGKTPPENSIEPGPVTDFLARHCIRPIVVVPPNALLTGRILVAYDGSISAQRALMTAAYIASLKNFEVRVVSVANDNDTAEKLLREAREYLSAYDFSSTYKSGIGAAMPWVTILNEIKEFKPGLISIGAYGSNKIMEFVFGSTTQEILIRSTCPVLLCR